MTYNTSHTDYYISIDWGYHCCVLVWLLALFAKLNRFFRKKCIPHFTPMHYNVVIAIKQGRQVDLIWCDSLQRNGQQALFTYAQFYHFFEQDMNRPKRYQPNRHYSSELTIRTHSPVLPRQINGTDCGIFTLLYHLTLSN